MKLLPARRRPMVRVETALLVVTVWILVLLNLPWWHAATAGRTWTDPQSWGFVLCVFASLVALHFASLAPFVNRRSARPLLTALVVTSAAAGYYMKTYAVILDPSMVQNVLKTDVREARDLLSWSMVAWVSLLSAPPVAFLWWVRLERRPWAKALGTRAACMVVALVVAVVAILPVNRDLTSLMRNQRELRYLITPGNLLYGLAKNSARDVRDANAPREAVGMDARLMRVSLASRPRVLVLVIGETARAANFSLLGYARPTTPQLARLDVTAFHRVTACGTSTEVSIPCLFSPWGREHYDERRIRNAEGLLDVLVRAGYAVKWLDNQSGCKGVCRGNGVVYEKVAASAAPELCPGDECYDGVLLHRLQAELANLQRDSVFVLHMMGNHGPAYFRRYPPEFRRFMPDCATAELRRCSREQVVNAYDNAILYTDHVLAGMIGALASQSHRMDAALLYVSDHGESLGEGGLYLHGLPYSIAPDTQTHVPMVAWLSPTFASSSSLSQHCLRARAHDELSHDNVFHSVIGLLDVRTRAYRAERDLFADCRLPAGASYAQADVEAGDPPL
jgi:lipid A ethanolaminephosphotransferase